MKYIFSMKAAKNGGVIVLVKACYDRPDTVVQITDAMKRMHQDPMLLSEPEPESEDVDLSGEYIFTNYDDNGNKCRAVTAALDFIDYIICGHGLGTQYGMF